MPGVPHSAAWGASDHAGERRTIIGAHGVTVPPAFRSEAFLDRNEPCGGRASVAAGQAAVRSGLG